MKFFTAGVFFLAASAAAVPPPSMPSPTLTSIDAHILSAAEQLSSVLESLGYRLPAPTAAPKGAHYDPGLVVAEARLDPARELEAEWFEDSEDEVSEVDELEDLHFDDLTLVSSPSASERIKATLANPAYHLFLAMGDRRVYAAVMLLVALVNLATIVLAISYLRRERETDCEADCEATLALPAASEKAFTATTP